MTPAALAQRIIATPARGARKVVGIAGPPASGKSTFAEQVACAIPSAQVVPMDGFHLDNAVLQPLGLLASKGAPQTFDASGFVALVARLRDSGALTYPTFDRDADAVIERGGGLPASCDTVIVEGNYLLLDEAPWDRLPAYFDLSVFLDVPAEILKARLVQRWLDYGLKPDAALARAQGNDLPNAVTVMDRSMPADVVLRAG